MEDENFGYPPDSILVTDGTPYTPESELKPGPIIVPDNVASLLLPVTGNPGAPTKTTGPFFALEPGQSFEVEITGKDAVSERVRIMAGTRRAGLKGRRFSSTIMEKEGSVFVQVTRVL
jgi:hypothetical protein